MGISWWPANKTLDPDFNSSLYFELHPGDPPGSLRFFNLLSLAEALIFLACFLVGVFS